MHNFIWFLQNNQTQLVGICQFDTFTRHQEKIPNILLLETQVRQRWVSKALPVANKVDDSASNSEQPGNKKKSK